MAMSTRCLALRHQLRDGRNVILRQVNAGDGAEIVQAFERLSADSRYQRFMQHKKELNPATLERGLHPQAGRDFVLLATIPAADGIDIVGAAQYVRAQEDDAELCEFAITVAEDWRGSGLSTQLLSSLLRQAPHDGYTVMQGAVMAENVPMLALARKLGFEIKRLPDDATVVRVWRALELGSPPALGV